MVYTDPQTYEVSYEFPIGSGKRVSRDFIASTPEDAEKLAGVKNPTLEVRIVDRNPISQYLKSEDGQQFVALLKEFENTMYAKVRKPSLFFDRYEKATGEKISQVTPGILLSTQDSKWGDELSIRFVLSGFEPNFPSGAKPRVYDGGRGILNDNDYIWTLIEKHGFRFGR
jgi:hypothetical protein